jgi:hypothetical protein
MASNSGASSASTASTTALMRRIGWSNGIRLSEVRMHSIVAWRMVVPRMLNLRKLNELPQDSHTRVTLSRALCVGSA